MGYCCSKDQHIQQLSSHSIVCKEPIYEDKENQKGNGENYLLKQMMNNTEHNDMEKHSLKDKFEKYFTRNNIKLDEETNNGMNSGRSYDNDNNTNNKYSLHNTQNINNIQHKNTLMLEYSYIFSGDYPVYLISNPKHNKD